MKLFSWLSISASFLALGSFAAPVDFATEYPDLVARAPNLALSLNEWKKKVKKPDGTEEITEWHFGFLLHAQGGPTIPADGSRPSKLPVLNWIVGGPNGHCMVYDDSETSQRYSQDSIKVTTNLIPAGGEADDAALRVAISKIFNTVKSQIKTNAPFKNCLDSTIPALELLKKAKYITQADFDKFNRFWYDNAKEVRKATNSIIYQMCGLLRRELGDDSELLEKRAPRCAGVKAGKGLKGGKGGPGPVKKSAIKKGGVGPAKKPLAKVAPPAPKVGGGKKATALAVKPKGKGPNAKPSGRK
ncbi:hypothetical protein DFP72DRAFT_922252 [Ephemerocybe angulata]|uniref:Uncharacterized protein n=1 Tax=Ephemerocybe angulata TaxID=980116 RepID=A0A8H6LXU2_9AGAR|nr:hypothetical protein DFP72DRAFT_922252 [Tulosesus angulatus]